MKKIILIAGGCSLAGLLIMMIALISVKGRISEFSTSNVDSVKQEYECSSEIIKIDADITSDNLEIRTGDVEFISVSYYNRPEYYEYEISESGDSLNIKYVDLNGPIKLFTVDLDFEDEPVIITVPKNFAGKVNISSTSGNILAETIHTSSLDLRNTSGNIRIYDVDTATDAKLSNTSGSINVDTLVCKNLTASNTSGGISIENSNIYEKLDTKCNSGDISIRSVSVKEGARLSTTSGTRYLENVTAEYLNCDGSSGSLKAVDVTVQYDFSSSTTSGSVTLERVEAGSGFKISASSGDVRGTIVGNEDDYKISADTSSGSCNLNDSNEGTKKLTVSTTSGSVNIDFTE
ncbi:MAG: DUF4097 family beta strand repeat protein [Lachnospiraceae bacterium]|nr:DUF4097 family beta strand repeat protein [Lachnospiraceae bacterium]